MKNEITSISFVLQQKGRAVFKNSAHGCPDPTLAKTLYSAQGVYRASSKILSEARMKVGIICNT